MTIPGVHESSCVPDDTYSASREGVAMSDYHTLLHLSVKTEGRGVKNCAPAVIFQLSRSHTKTKYQPSFGYPDPHV